MALGTTNISTTLVGNAIGISSKDVGTLCSSPTINKWSKHKPVIYPAISTTGNWWKAVDGNCGLSITEYSNINNLVTAITNGVTWNYNKPTGGASSPYRLGDFRGYAHDAYIPFGGFYVPPTAYSNSANSVVGAAMELLMSLGEIDSLAITDIDKIKDWYFGCYMIKSSGSVLYPRYITTAKPISDGTSSVEIPIYGLPSGTYYVYPFLCQNHRASLDITESPNTFVAFDGITRQTVNITNNPIVVFIDARWRNDNVNSGVIEMEIGLTNNASASVTLQNCYAAMRYGSKAYQDPYLLGEKSEALGSITIPANSTVTRNLSFSINNSDSTSGWKAWFITSSPYNIVVGTDVVHIDINP